MKAIQSSIAAALLATLFVAGAARADSSAPNQVVCGHCETHSDAQTSVRRAMNHGGSSRHDHRRRVFAHHRLTPALPVAAASEAPQGVARPSPMREQLAFSNNACTGANGWSLLCPGAQIMGISY